MPPARYGRRSLQRGTACLPCRTRKLKCGGEKPHCGQCSRLNRDHECRYEDPRTWGKARQMALDIHELQRKLESTHHEVRVLTAALQFASPPTSVLSLPPQFPPQSASNFTCSTPPSMAPGFEAAPSLSDQQLVMASHGRADAPGTLQLQSPVQGAQPQSAPTFQQLGVTPAHQAVMLDLFFPHAGQLNFELDPNEIMKRVEGPPDKYPHESLLYAMFLLACQFNKGSAANCHETKFRQHAQHSLSQDVFQTDVHYDRVRACSLLAVYAFLNDYPGEAQRHMLQAKQFAVHVAQTSPQEAGHSLSSLTTGDFETLHSFHGLHSDQQLTLQQAFTIDRLIAAGLGTEALFPSHLGYLSFENVSAFIDMGNQPIPTPNYPTPSASVYSSLRSPSKQKPLERNAISALRARTADLFWMASRSRAFRMVGTQFLLRSSDDEFRDLRAQLRNLRGHLPSIHLPASHPQGDGQSPSNVDRSILSVHIQVCAAMVRLMPGVPEDAEEAGSNQVGEIVALIKELFDNDYRYLDPIIGLCWQWVVEHLLEELAVPEHSDHKRCEFREVIRFILTAMHKLAAELPVVSVNIANVMAPCNVWGVILP